MLLYETELKAERARRSLRTFLEHAWVHIEPGTPFVSGFHVDAVCEHLEAVARGEIRRLLINVPPRHGKSLITSAAFPAWAWISRPELRFMYASYGIELAVRDSVRTRRLIESPWYRDRWGRLYRLRDDQNVKARFETDRGGTRLATSVGGAATGEGADIIVIDDPHKVEQAASAIARESVLEWFSGTMSTRLNDPRTGAMVVIGQRLHELDLFGHLLDDEEWTHLCLPAEYDARHPALWPSDPRSGQGELLWPERFGREEIERLKRDLGSYGAAAQLQQLPAPAGGGIFERRWWRWYDPDGSPPNVTRLLQSWDLTFSGGPRSDYVVGQLWAVNEADVYLLRQVRAQLTFTATLAAIRELTAWANERFPGFKGHAILIEETANGAAVLDFLKREIPGTIAVRPEGDKVSRAHAVSPQVEAGNVYLPGFANADGSGYDHARTPGWVQDLVEEAASFPRGAHDDQVDALTQALTRARDTGFRLRVLTAPSHRRPLSYGGW